MLSFLGLLLWLSPAFARSGADDGPPAPAALFVLLPYSTQRIHMLEARGDQATARELRKAQAEMRERLIADFQDNFHYGSYYFVADSNAEKAIAGQWDGILLDSALRPAGTVPFPADDSTILFAYYGYRDRGISKTTLLREGEGDAMAQGLDPIYQTLVLCDRQLNQFPRRMQRRAGNPNPPLLMRKPAYVYYYRSRAFNISYNAAAAALAVRMMRFFGPPPVFR